MERFKEQIISVLKDVLSDNHIDTANVVVNPTTSLKFGHYTTSIALDAFKNLQDKSAYKNPIEFAKKIADSDKFKNLDFVEKVEVAGPGFLNFYLNPIAIVNKVIADVAYQDYGKSDNLNELKIIFEYTDPNPFKEFHIGHLMNNTIGESLSRLYKFCGADVKNANYQGDVGLHIAKSIYGLMGMLKEENKTINDIDKLNPVAKVNYLGKAYALGSKEYDKPDIKDNIDRLNKTIYDKSDSEINRIFEVGRKWSLEYFDTIYDKLGTEFDFYFFESEVAETGKKIVLENQKKGIFEESEGAVIFRGEKYGLHTRVFINKLGIPTYEAKELALPFLKFEKYKYNKSVIVTGNEIKEYFRVLLTALKLIDPKIAEKALHMPCGMLRLTSGKMSSRTGTVITAENLLNEISQEATKLILNAKESKQKNNPQLAETLAIAAIKYSILKNGIGKDIIFNPGEALSLTGNTGPYIQYTNARALSVLEKSDKDFYIENIENENLNDIEKEIIFKLYLFPDIIIKAANDFAPNQVATYLFELAQLYNSFYNSNKIIGSENENFRLMLSKAVSIVLTNGLNVLGIKAPQKM